MWRVKMSNLVSHWTYRSLPEQNTRCRFIRNLLLQSTFNLISHIMRLVVYPCLFVYMVISHKHTIPNVLSSTNISQQQLKNNINTHSRKTTHQHQQQEINNTVTPVITKKTWIPKHEYIHEINNTQSV